MIFDEADRCEYTDENGRCGLEKEHAGAHYEAPWRNEPMIYPTSDSVVTVQRTGRAQLTLQVVKSDTSNDTRSVIELEMSLEMGAKIEQAFRSARGGGGEWLE